MSIKNRRTTKKAAANLIWLAVAAVAAAVLYFYPPARQALGLGGDKLAQASVNADGSLTVHFIDVGQGDATLITAPDGTAMLIDAGPNSSEDALRAYLDAQKIKTLKYVVFTHPHEDHIGGGDMIMNNYTVETVIMPSVVSDTSTFEHLVDAISESHARALAADDIVGMKYLLGDSTVSPEFTVLAPVSSDYDNLNNASVVLRLDYGSASFLFTGDAEKASESDQLAKYGAGALNCDVLKVGHHGSKSSTSQEYLDAVSPSMAVIFCAKINDYGHPHAETTERLTASGAKIYGTYALGTIIMRTDGANIEVITK